MVVLLKFRFGEISLCYTKGVWFFLFAEVYIFCDRPAKEGGSNDLNGFFLPSGGEKKTVPKPKILLKPQKSQMEAIFVKNQNWNSFQVFERFFF